jgi:hypothetical protein
LGCTLVGFLQRICKRVAGHGFYKDRKNRASLIDGLNLGYWCLNSSTLNKEIIRLQEGRNQYQREAIYLNFANIFLNKWGQLSSIGKKI